MTKKNYKGRVPSLTRCVEILDLIASRKQITGADILESLAIPKSTLYVLINAMEELGLIRKSEDGGKLQLGLKLMSLGQLAAERLDLREIAYPFMRALIETEPCYSSVLGILDGDHAYYAAKVINTQRGITTISRVGQEISLVRAGIGKCLLAFSPDSMRERLLPVLDYHVVTETSITTPEALRKELANIRLRGWALGNCEGERGVRSVVAPVFNSCNAIECAVSIEGPVNEFTDDKLEEIAGKVKQCAAGLTQALSGRAA